MPFSISRDLCLICLTVLILLLPQVYPQCHVASPRAPHVAHTCCLETSKAYVHERIKSCFIQTVYICRIPAYMFRSANGTKYCVDPTADWLQKRLQQLQKKKVCCT